MSTDCCGAPRRCYCWRNGVEPREQINPQTVETELLGLKTEDLGLELFNTTYCSKRYAVAISSAVIQPLTFK